MKFNIKYLNLGGMQNKERIDVITIGLKFNIDVLKLDLETKLENFGITYTHYNDNTSSLSNSGFAKSLKLEEDSVKNLDNFNLKGITNKTIIFDFKSYFKYDDFKSFPDTEENIYIIPLNPNDDNDVLLSNSFILKSVDENDKIIPYWVPFTYLSDWDDYEEIYSNQLYNFYNIFNIPNIVNSKSIIIEYIYLIDEFIIVNTNFLKNTMEIFYRYFNFNEEIALIQSGPRSSGKFPGKFPVSNETNQVLKDWQVVTHSDSSNKQQIIIDAPLKDQKTDVPKNYHSSTIPQEAMSSKNQKKEIVFDFTFSSTSSQPKETQKSTTDDLSSSNQSISQAKAEPIPEIPSSKNEQPINRPKLAFLNNIQQGTQLKSVNNSPKKEPKGNTGLLSQIQQGTQLKPTESSSSTPSKPNPGLLAQLQQGTKLKPPDSPRKNQTPKPLNMLEQIKKKQEEQMQRQKENDQSIDEILAKQKQEKLSSPQLNFVSNLRPGQRPVPSATPTASESELQRRLRLQRERNEK